MPTGLGKAMARFCALISLIATLFVGSASIIVQAAPSPAHQQDFRGALATFVGNQVRLTTTSGITVSVATDDATRMNPLFTQLASVSPDGNRLLYVTGDTEAMRNAVVTVVNLKSFVKQNIANLGDSFWIHAPLWSPDSSHILYVLQNTTTLAPEVWVMTATGADRRLAASGGALTHTSLEGFAALAPRWSTDGSSIVFDDSAYRPTTQWSVSLATGAHTAQVSPKLCTTATRAGDVAPFCGGGSICYVPVYYQNNQSWSGDIMQSGGDTIGNAGCALTALTMLFDYNGSTVGNPGGMNNCLSPWGYAEPLNWYGAQVNPPNGPGCDRYTTNWIEQVGFSWSTLNSYLNSGWPVILGGCWDAPTCNQTHWIVVTGGDGSDNPGAYMVNDPWQGEATSLAMLTNRGFTMEWLSLYQKASGPGSPCQ